MNLLNVENIIFVVTSLLSSKPGINEDNNPGKDNFSSSLFSFKNIGSTIFSKIFFLFGSEAFGKNGNKP